MIVEPSNGLDTVAKRRPPACYATDLVNNLLEADCDPRILEVPVILRVVNQLRDFVESQLLRGK
jgi:hypothetical protein